MKGGLLNQINEWSSGIVNFEDLDRKLICQSETYQTILRLIRIDNEHPSRKRSLKSGTGDFVFIKAKFRLQSPGLHGHRIAKGEQAVLQYPKTIRVSIVWTCVCPDRSEGGNGGLERQEILQWKI